MHILTSTGYKPLHPKQYSPPRDEKFEEYCGPFPSFELLAFVSKLERVHLEWEQRRKRLEDAERI
jgi:hypothetical protein